MALTLAEGLVDEVDTYIQANIAAKLSALDTEYGDGITLAVPAAYHIAEKALKSIQTYPVLYILVEATEFDAYTPDNVDAAHDLVVGVIALDQDDENLQRRLYRYARAVWELLVEAEFAAGSNFNLAIGGTARIDFSPLFSDAESRYIGDAAVRVRTRMLETK